MNGLIDRVICFEHPILDYLALEAEVELITFRYAQVGLNSSQRISSTGDTIYKSLRCSAGGGRRSHSRANSGKHRSNFVYRCECTWKTCRDRSKDLCSTRIGCGSSNCIRIVRDEIPSCILNRVGDRTKQDTIIEDACASADHSLSIFERRPGNADSRPEIVIIR